MRLETLVGVAAVTAPGLHLATDVVEWATGFFPAMLWLNYGSFAVTPFLVIGIYAVQRPKIGGAGLLGALLYGASFVYFAHTSLYAIAERSPDYETLWAQLGPVYTFHGGMMVVGGLLFGLATLRAEVLPKWTALLLMAGSLLSLVLAVLPFPDILQTLGNTLRNIGFIGMGVSLLRDSKPRSERGA